MLQGIQSLLLFESWNGSAGSTSLMDCAGHVMAMQWELLGDGA